MNETERSGNNMSGIKRSKMIRKISSVIFYFVFVSVLLMITARVIGDIFSYTDSGTSFPPFASSAVLAVMSSPVLLASLIFYLLAGRWYHRCVLPEHNQEMLGEIHRQRALTGRTGLIVFVFAVLMIVTGTFISIRMGVNSWFFVRLRLQYLGISYGPVLIVSLLLALRRGEG